MYFGNGDGYGRDQKNWNYAFLLILSNTVAHEVSVEIGTAAQLEG